MGPGVPGPGAHSPTGQVHPQVHFIVENLYLNIQYIVQSSYGFQGETPNTFIVDQLRATELEQRCERSKIVSNSGRNAEKIL